MITPTVLSIIENTIQRIIQWELTIRKININNNLTQNANSKCCNDIYLIETAKEMLADN